MKVCVVGAGVIGLATAFALARKGHEITVFESAADPATGVSHGNGGQLSYSYAEPFASPSILPDLIKYTFGFSKGVKFHLRPNLRYLEWGLSFLLNSMPQRYIANLKAMTSLAAESQRVNQSWLAEGDNFFSPHTSKGKIVLASTPRQLLHMQKMQAIKQECGIATDILSTEDVIRCEPMLASWQQSFIGGFFAADDLTIDPLIYCNWLKEKSEKEYGVRFIFDSKVTNIITRNNKLAAIVTHCREHDCKHLILCTGGEQIRLNGKNLKNQAYPLQGYSLTLPTEKLMPAISVTDLENKILFAPLKNSCDGAQNIRISAFVDVNSKAEKTPMRLQDLRSLAQLLWPDIVDYTAEGKNWTDFRPSMPSAVPMIKKGPVKGLYFNFGHGALGLTFAAGSAARVLSLIEEG